ncbi:unnamed protein product [Cuscuta campestris]|uniref:Uncharacterized protein n=1 Tax=Cuscuta campestris TaxID=132261 RepID=A0A484KVY5_9ASTE|nr:unnamed protein product [Cuscuta campestris]
MDHSRLDSSIRGTHEAGAVHLSQIRPRLAEEDRKKGLPERTAAAVACLGDLLDLVVDRRKELLGNEDCQKGGPPEMRTAKRRLVISVHGMPLPSEARHCRLWLAREVGARCRTNAKVAVVCCWIPSEVKHARGLADLGGCSPTLVEGTAAALPRARCSPERSPSSVARWWSGL